MPVCAVLGGKGGTRERDWSKTRDPGREEILTALPLKAMITHSDEGPLLVPWRRTGQAHSPGLSRFSPPCLHSRSSRLPVPSQLLPSLGFSCRLDFASVSSPQMRPCSPPWTREWPPFPSSVSTFSFPLHPFPDLKYCLFLFIRLCILFPC